MIYEIQVKGHLSPEWLEWLEGMSITHTPMLKRSSPVQSGDQAALFGVPIKVRDFLISVNQVHSEPE